MIQDEYSMKKTHYLKIVVIVVFFSICFSFLAAWFFGTRWLGISAGPVIIKDQAYTVVNYYTDNNGNTVAVIKPYTNSQVYWIASKFFVIILITILSMNAIILVCIVNFVIKPIRKEEQDFMQRMLLEKQNFRKDNLTGLCRREVFEERRKWYEEEYVSIGLIFVDINDLKHINDQFGHDAGDEMISKVAKAIKDMRREYTELDHFRWGGDEFIIVVKEASESKCRQLMESVNSKIANITLKKANDTKVSAAVGMAFSDSNISMEKLLRAADENMYKVKQFMKKSNKENKVDP